MKIKRVEATIEAILYATGDAVELNSLAQCVGHDKETTRRIIYKMMDKYDSEDRGIKIVEIDNSFQMCTKPEMYEAIIKLINVPKRHVLTDVLLETLSIIAYKQPITRAEVEAIRGVSCIHSINKLIEYNLVCELGRMDSPGKPILFGTSQDFLRSFGLESIDELPEIKSDKIIDFKKKVKEQAIEEYPDEFGEDSDFDESKLEIAITEELADSEKIIHSDEKAANEEESENIEVSSEVAGSEDAGIEEENNEEVDNEE